MTDLLIYLTDPEFREEVEDVFPPEQYQVRVVQDQEALLKACLEDLLDAVLVWTATPELVEELLSLLSEHALDHLPVIPVVREGILVNQLLDLPVAEVVVIPLPREEFFILLQQVLKDVHTRSTVLTPSRWEGNLEDYNLVDLIQMVELSGRTAVLKIEFLGAVGQVEFDNGRLISAELNGTKGLAALEKLAILNQGRFRVLFLPAPESARGSKFKTDELLVHLVSRLHEWADQSKGLPEPETEILSNPFQPVKKGAPLEEKLYQFFQQPRPLISAILELDVPNDKIIAALQRLFRAGSLGPRDKIEQLIHQEQEKPGLSKLLGGIGSLFKKKKEQAELVQPESQTNDRPEELVPEPIVHRPNISSQHLEQIKRTLGSKA